MSIKKIDTERFLLWLKSQKKPKNTQQYWANKANIDKSTISRMIHGKEVSTDNILDLAEAMGCDYRWLTGESDYFSNNDWLEAFGANAVKHARFENNLIMLLSEFCKNDAVDYFTEEIQAYYENGELRVFVSGDDFHQFEELSDYERVTLKRKLSNAVINSFNDFMNLRGVFTHELLKKYDPDYGKDDEQNHEDLDPEVKKLIDERIRETAPHER